MNVGIRARRRARRCRGQKASAAKSSLTAPTCIFRFRLRETSTSWRDLPYLVGIKDPNVDFFRTFSNPLTFGILTALGTHSTYRALSSNTGSRVDSLDSDSEPVKKTDLEKDHNDEVEGVMTFDVNGTVRLLILEMIFI